MATDLVVHVILPPIGGDHVAAILRSHAWSGFSDVDAPPGALAEAAANTAAAAAAARVASNDALAKATLESPLLRNVPNPRGMERRPLTQLMALCPSMALGGSGDVPEGHTLWTFVGEPAAIDHRRTRTVLDAMRKAGASPEAVETMATRLAEHLGRTMLILAH